MGNCTSLEAEEVPDEAPQQETNFETAVSQENGQGEEDDHHSSGRVSNFTISSNSSKNRKMSKQRKKDREKASQVPKAENNQNNSGTRKNISDDDCPEGGVKVASEVKNPQDFTDITQQTARAIGNNVNEKTAACPNPLNLVTILSQGPRSSAMGGSQVLRKRQSILPISRLLSPHRTRARALLNFRGGTSIERHGKIFLLLTLQERLAIVSEVLDGPCSKERKALLLEGEGFLFLHPSKTAEGPLPLDVYETVCSSLSQSNVVRSVQEVVSDNAERFAALHHKVAMSSWEEAASTALGLSSTLCDRGFDRLAAAVFTLGQLCIDIVYLLLSAEERRFAELADMCPTIDVFCDNNNATSSSLFLMPTTSSDAIESNGNSRRRLSKANVIPTSPTHREMQSGSLLAGAIESPARCGERFFSQLPKLGEFLRRAALYVDLVVQSLCEPLPVRMQQ